MNVLSRVRYLGLALLATLLIANFGPIDFGHDAPSAAASTPEIDYSASFSGDDYWQNTSFDGLPAAANQAFSIDLWINPANVSDNYNHILDFAELDGDGFVSSKARGYIKLRYAEIVYLLYDGTGSEQTCGTVTTGTWHHIALTVGSDGDVNCYLNGVDKTASSVSYSNSKAFGTTLVVGSYSYSTTDRTHHFDGEIDQIKFWSAELTEAEVRESRLSWGNRFGGADINSGSLEALYDFNNGSTTTAEDRVGANDLSGQGTPSIAQVSSRFVMKSSPEPGKCTSSEPIVCNVAGASLSFKQLDGQTAQPTTYSQTTNIIGSAPSDGDVFNYVDVFSDGTVDVDATVEILSATGSVTLDKNENSTMGRDSLQTFISGSTADISYQIDFVSGSSLVEMQNLEVLVRDLDGGDQDERAEFSGLVTYSTLASGSTVSVSTPSAGTRLFSGTVGEGVPDKNGWASVLFASATSVGFRAYADGSGGGVGFELGRTDDEWHSAADSLTPSGAVTLSTISVAEASRTITIDTQSATAGSAVASVSGTGYLTLPAGTGLSKNGLNISSWNLRADGSGTTLPLGAQYKPSANVTAYAQYSASVTAPTVSASNVGTAYTLAAPTTAGFSSSDLTYSIASGTLPAGLSIDSATGVISGTPTAAGSFSVSIKATHDLGGSATSSSFSISVGRGTQSISWSPTTAVELADSGLTLGATLTVGDGSVGYEVVSAGTTGCSVSGSTLTFSSTGSGANGCEVRPTATSTSNYNAKTDAATVTFDVARGTFEISAPSSKVGTSSSRFTDVCDSSCDVTGFAAADTVRVVVSESDGSALSGEVKLTSATGLTQSLDGYQSDATATGLNELAFTGTQAQVNAALETLQYKSPTGGGDETIGISASLSGAAYFSGTGHYYEVISGDNKTHAQAITAAASRTFNGLNGYLATILTEEENRFIDGKISDRSVWIGGKYNGTEWEWITGPIGDQVSFWTGTSPGSAISGVYAEWEPGQPDGSDVCLSTNYDGGDADNLGNWDDLTCTASKKWVVEYGGNGGTVLKQASTTFDVGAPTAPLQVSGVSVSAGNTQLTVSWSAPGAGGSAITDYVIEQSTDGGATWTTLSDGTSTSTSYTVTGLTNGSSYSFRVSAKNAIGTGTASSFASGTPVVPAAASTSRNNDDDEPVVAPVVTPTVTRPTVRLPFPTPTPPRPTVLSAPVKSSTSVSTPVDRLVSRIGGVPAPVTTSTNGDDELSVSTSSMRLSLKMSQQASVSETPEANAELTIKPGAKAAVTATGLLPNTTLQVWLPNVTDRELGRLSVNASGEIQGELGLSSSLGEDPLPVGRQTLQMTGYDADGNQTVVEMPVNIAQGPPTPEPNRQAGALPELGTGQSLATSAGVPTSTTVSVLQEQNAVSVTGDGWGINMNIPAVSGTVEDDNGQPVIRLVQTSMASMTGSGMQPGTVASVWFFSEPTLMGTAAVAEDGSFALDVLVDAQFIPVGNHTVQVQGVGTDGYIKSVNMGVLVEEPAAQTTASSAMVMLWWTLAIAVFIALLVVILVDRRRRRA